MVVWVGGIILALVLLYAGWTYNRLVALRKRSDGAWSDIDVQLKRRWDLVPALVEAVRGYAGHESKTLESVVEARSRATQAGSVAQRGDSEQGLSSAVANVFAIAEAYPDLKANSNFLDLQKNLTNIENDVQSARRYYNAVVRDINTLIAGFPSLLIAAPLGFHEREFFQIDQAERAAPQVRL